MSPKKIRRISIRNNIFLPTFLALILSFSTLAYAVVLDNGNAKSKAPSPSIASSEEPEYAPNEVIVKLKQKQSPSTLYSMNYSQRASIDTDTLSSIKAKYDLKDEKPVFNSLHQQLKARNISQAQLEKKNALSKAASMPPTQFVDLLPIYILKTDQSVLEVCNKLKQDPDIEYAQPNHIMKPCMVPNDPYYHSSGGWGQTYDDLWGVKKIQCEQAWDISQGEGVVVAVIDTGVDYNHPDLWDNIWVNPAIVPDRNHDGKVDLNDCDLNHNRIIEPNEIVNNMFGWDFSGNVFVGDPANAVPDNDPSDYYGHGTHAAGTIAATGNNNIGVIGVAPKAKIMPVKIFPNSYNTICAEGIAYAADNGAKILSNSWGPKNRNPSNPLLETAIDYAYDRGCVVVFSAGNSNDDVACYSPANYPKVITIAATNYRDQKASFSNYGAKIDITAPGVEILSLRASGTDMYLGSSGYSPGARFVPAFDQNAKYYRANGTSMACPHAAGIMALAVSSNPQASNEEIKTILQVSSDDIGQIGHDPYFGYGRANALRALKISHACASISSPLSQSYVRGTVDIFGSAYIENSFERYELYYAPNKEPQNMTRFAYSDTPVVSELLGILDTTQCSEGRYIIILKVFYTGGAEVTRSAEVIIDNVNDPPILNLRNQTIPIGQLAEFTINVSDPDDPQTPQGTVACSVTNLPPGATFDPARNSVSWQPSEQDKGIYEITVTAADSEHTVTGNFILGTVVVKTSIISENPVSIFSTVIYDNIIAWIETRNTPGGRENGCYIYDLTTGLETLIVPITDASVKIFDVSIYNDKIVYWKEINGIQRIYMYDVSTGIEVPISEEYSYHNLLSQTPEINQDKVVWVFSNIGSDKGISIYDITTNSEIKLSDICAFGLNIFGNTLVWGDASTPGLCIYNLLTSQKTIVPSRINMCDNPPIYNNRIVWAYLNEEKADYSWDISMYDLATQEIRDIFSGPRAQIGPAIYEDKIIFTNSWDGSAGSNMMMYDLSTETEVQITGQTPMIVDLDPAIYQNKIVWLRNNWVIRKAQLCLANFFFAPYIVSVMPSEVPIGGLITINGANFGYNYQNSYIEFKNGSHAIVESWSDKCITCRVPAAAESGILKVITPGGASNDKVIMITATIAATASQGGSITPSGNIIVNAGQDQLFTIIPNTGYSIKDVTVDSVSIGAVSTYTFSKVTQNHTINATFIKETVISIELNMSAWELNKVKLGENRTNYDGSNSPIHKIKNTGTVPIFVGMAYVPVDASAGTPQPGLEQGLDTFITIAQSVVIPPVGEVHIIKGLAPAAEEPVNLTYGAPTELSKTISGMEAVYEFRAYPAAINKIKPLDKEVRLKQ